MLEMVRDARQHGLKTPVMFMGYYNPILSYGESKLMADCKEVGVNGFIVVDLPLQEAIRFREGCTKTGYETKYLLVMTLTKIVKLAGSPTSH